MKVDKLDKKLLYRLDQNARLPYTQLGSYVNRSKSTARYRVKKLQENGFINKFSIWLDPAKLGYRPYKIYLSVQNAAQRKQSLLTTVKETRNVFWLGVADGDWDIGITYFAKRDNTFYSFEQNILANYSDIILDKDTGVLLNVHVRPKQFLHDGDLDGGTLFAQRANHDLDTAEKTMIRTLYKDSTTPLVRLADQTGLSVEGVRQKKQRLEEHKIINHYNARVNYSKLDYDFYKTFLYTRQFAEHKFQKLERFIDDQPNIIHYTRQISPWAVELETVAHSFSKYNTIIRELKREFADTITNISTAVMYEDHIFPADQPLL